jgi:hypothetical protein
MKYGLGAIEEVIETERKRQVAGAPTICFNLFSRLLKNPKSMRRNREHSGFE